MSRRLISSRLVAGLACAGVWLSAPAARPDTCSGLSLSALTPFGVGTNPTAVTAGDFNHDGRLDVAVLNAATNNVSIMLGDGLGGFAEALPGSPYTTTGVDVPTEIVAGDLDLDGALDLVVSSATTTNAKVLKGAGTGTFTPLTAFQLGPTGPLPLAPSRGSRLYLGLLTDDADLDLVALDESGFRIRVYRGTAGAAFDNLNPTQDIDLDLPNPLDDDETPSAAALLDFDRNGTLDVAVALRSIDLVRVYYGDGAGKLTAGPSDGTGDEPADLAAGDVDRDGWVDLVSADFRDGRATTLRNTSNGTALKNEGFIDVAQGPTRIALSDLDHNGLIDLAVLDEPRAQVNAFSGQKTAPFFDPNAYTATLPKPGPRGLVVGSFTGDGRDDFVTALHDDPRTAVVVENRSGMPCVRVSYAGAPRSYPAGSLGPLGSAAADFDEDGRTDLVVATNTELRILRNANGGLAESLLIGSISPFVRAVAVGDLNVDGNADVVLALGQPGPGAVRVYLGNGAGGLGPGTSYVAGSNTSSLVVADFTGDGAPDVAAPSEDTGQIFFFKGNGAGGLVAGTTIAASGSGPRAIVAADFNGDFKLDLAVAQSGSNNVRLLGGNGDGTFVAGPLLGVGLGPQGLAVADLSGDGKPDLVTADNGSAQVSVLINNGLGGFLPASAVAVGTNPTAVALLQLVGEAKPDIAVTTAATSGAHSLSVLRNNGTGGFPFASTDYPVRISPQAITPLDVDSDGLLDLAVPCRSADGVVVLVQRPPVLSEAPRVGVADEPRSAVSGDFDGDGDLDVAVASSVGGKVIVLDGDAMGGLGTPDTYLAAGAESVVAGDFDRDGDLDLAVSAPGELPPAVAVLLNSGGGAFAPQPPVTIAGWSPDELVAGDFDRDGLLDLAVCSKLTPVGRIEILRNAGGGVFAPAASVPVGDKPTAIVSADFDHDGDLDLAVANELGAGSDVRILANNGAGSFAIVQTLPLIGGDQNPVSLAAADFDGDGSIDLAAAALVIDRIHLFRNTPGTGFTPVTALDSPYILQSLTTGDLNLDGKTDLVAIASGVSVYRGTGGLAFDAPQTVVAGHTPAAAAVSDFDRDGRPDLVVLNQGSDDVSILRSTACSPKALEVSLQPAGCSAGSPPYARDTAATAYDDGGNVAVCASGAVTPAISPGTGDPTAVLGGPGVAGAPYLDGVATFSGGSFLTIDKPGRRYSLQLTGPGMPPVHTRRFTLGPSPQILGPSSVCPSSSGQWQMEGTPDFYDSYAWSLSPSGPIPYDVQPFAYTPAVTLPNPPLNGPFQLGVTARVDQCVVSPTPVDIYFGPLTSVSLQTIGASSVCVDCIGGSSKAIEVGGGAVTRQWGYRTVSGIGSPISIPGETGEVYVLKGANFPGPGNYFVVVTSTPTCGSPTVSTEWPVTVVASVPSGEVRNLAASSRGTPAGGQNQLRWVNTTGAAEEIRIRWDEAPAGTSNCISPPGVGSPFDGEAVISSPAPSAKDGFLHSGPGVLLDTAYCYTVFVKVSGVYSPGRTVKARPFDATPGPLKWAYATGGTAVAPPTVSTAGVVVMSNDRTVHALTRGETGGDWPGPWMPTDLMGVAHSRSPVIPFAPPLGGSNAVLFAVDDGTPGHLHAIDANTGNRPWPPATQPLTTVGAPGGMFTLFGGIRDALFVGTRDNSVDNALRALSVASGSLLEAYAPSASPGPIGPINGSPAIDYATRRVYFASHKRLGGDTLFCLELGASSPVFSYRWSRDLGHITGSPVLRGGRVYVGSDAGIVYSIEALDGLQANDRTYSTLDGPVKGFVFPDRRNDDLMFATNTKVWSLSDDGSATMALNWTFAPGGLNPSIVLYWPLTNFVYVGSANGELYELDFTSATPSTPPTFKLQVLGGGLGQVGAPSLDIGVTPRLLMVGSEPGVVYGLTIPFP